jgi:hypothetical protein
MLSESERDSLSDMLFNIDLAISFAEGSTTNASWRIRGRFTQSRAALRSSQKHRAACLPK